jgi:hypothetical protein
VECESKGSLSAPPARSQLRRYLRRMAPCKQIARMAPQRRRWGPCGCTHATQRPSTCHLSTQLLPNRVAIDNLHVVDPAFHRCEPRKSRCSPSTVAARGACLSGSAHGSLPAPPLPSNSEFSCAVPIPGLISKRRKRCDAARCTRAGESINGAALCGRPEARAGDADKDAKGVDGETPLHRRQAEPHPPAPSKHCARASTRASTPVAA